MLDIGWSEFLIVSIVALVVIGPRDLPKAMYTVGKWVRTARKVAGEFQRHVDDMVRDTELDEVRKGLQSAKSFNPKHQLEKFVDPKGQLKHAFDPTGGDKSAAPKKAPAAADGAGTKSDPGDDTALAEQVAGSVPSLRESQPDPVKVKPASAAETRNEDGAARPKPAVRRARTGSAGRSAESPPKTKTSSTRKAPPPRKKSTTAKAAESTEAPAKRRSGAASTGGKKPAAATKTSKSAGTTTPAKRAPTRRRKAAEPATPPTADSNE